MRPSSLIAGCDPVYRQWLPLFMGKKKPRSWIAALFVRASELASELESALESASVLESVLELAPAPVRS